MVVQFLRICFMLKGSCPLKLKYAISCCCSLFFTCILQSSVMISLRDDLYPHLIIWLEWRVIGDIGNGCGDRQTGPIDMDTFRRGTHRYYLGPSPEENTKLSQTRLNYSGDKNTLNLFNEIIQTLSRQIRIWTHSHSEDRDFKSVCPLNPWLYDKELQMTLDLAFKGQRSLN